MKQLKHGIQFAPRANKAQKKTHLTLVAHHFDPWSKRAFSRAVGVKIKLILEDILKVFIDGEILFERKPQLALPRKHVAALHIVPTALHVSQILQWIIAGPRK